MKYPHVLKTGNSLVQVLFIKPLIKLSPKSDWCLCSQSYICSVPVPFTALIHGCLIRNSESGKDKTKVYKCSWSTNWQKCRQYSCQIPEINQPCYTSPFIYHLHKASLHSLNILTWGCSVQIAAEKRESL